MGWSEAAPRAQDAAGNSALHRCAQAGHGPACLHVLRYAGPGAVHVRNGHGLTPLHCAVLADAYGATMALLRAGADVNATDGHGRTPLALAGMVRVGLELYQLLLRQPGVALNVRDGDGHTPLHAAIDWGCTEHARLLLRRPGCTYDARTHDGIRPLDLAARSCPELLPDLAARMAGLDAADGAE